MTIFILSHHTPKPPILDWLGKFKKFMVVIDESHTPEEINEYVQTFGARVLICPQGNLSQKREWLLKRHKKNTWVIMACDNITKVTGIHPDSKVGMAPTRKDLSYEYSPEEIEELFREEIKSVAQGYGGGLIGFASNNNHFFRKWHHHSVGFVWGKLIAMKNDGTPWRHDLIGMEDYAFTAQYLLHSGAVWINKWIYAHKKNTISHNMKEKLRACKVLVEQFKGLYRYKDRPGKPKNSEIQMRLTADVQIMKWRMQFKTKTYQQS